MPQPPLRSMIGARFISTSAERLDSNVLIYQALQKFVLTLKVLFVFLLRECLGEELKGGTESYGINDLVSY